MKKAINADAIVKGFFWRTFWITSILAGCLLIVLPLLIRMIEVQQYKTESIQMLDKFIRNELTFELGQLLNDDLKTNEILNKVNVFMRLSGLVEFKIWRADTTCLYSYTDPSMIGRQFPDNNDLIETVEDQHVEAVIEEAGEIENEALKGMGDLLEVYVPVIQDGAVVGAVEVYRLAPEVSFVGQHIFFVAGLSIVVLVLLYMLLYGTFKGASKQLVLYDRELESAYSTLGHSYFDTIRSLVKALELRDMETEGHSERVVAISAHLGRKMGLGREELGRLVLGSYLHDIGKIGVSDNILLKKGRLDQEERKLMQMHVMKGYDTIKEVDILMDATDVVLGHHEKWDGSGYPKGIKGDEIPIAARIFALVDVLDALMSKRPYKEALSLDEARRIINEDSGTHFDPSVVDAFNSISKEDLFGVLEEVARSGVTTMVMDALAGFTEITASQLGEAM